MKTLIISAMTFASVVTLYISHNYFDQDQKLSDHKEVKQSVEKTKEVLKATRTPKKKISPKATKKDMDRHKFKELLEEDIQFIEMT